ncbi:MAG TPA: helix-turn-helix transcriptional regulator [Pyrinomonadaceae bacterium]|nr:helix-turn-helix transcriptional regulator [Pyrinomonadaceae bacterium]
MTSFKEFLEEQLLDEEFASHYDEVSAEMDLALELVTRREKLGLTQQQLADATGIKQPMIARIEGGQMPSPKTLQRLAKALQVGVLFTGEGIMVMPLAGSKSVPHYQPHYQSASEGMGHQLWTLYMQNTAHKRQKIECDYTLLKRMAETDNIARRSKQKEKPNAGLELAA